MNLKQAVKPVDTKGPRESSLRQVKENLEFIISEKGNMNVILDGIKFQKMLEKEGRVYWACSYRKKAKCKARLTQDPVRGTFHYSSVFEHTHQEKNFVWKRRKKLQSLIKFKTKFSWTVQHELCKSGAHVEQTRSDHLNCQRSALQEARLKPFWKSILLGLPKDVNQGSMLC